MLPDVKEAVAAFGAEPTGRPLAGTVRSDEALLSEDPGIPVGLARTPVILDPFMLPRLTAPRPEAIDDLVGRSRHANGI